MEGMHLAKQNALFIRCPDVTKMRTLGYEPKVSLKEGLKKTIDWYINEEYTQNNVTSGEIAR